MFEDKWAKEANSVYQKLKADAITCKESRRIKGQKKSSKQEGLFRQVAKTIRQLKSNPRHNGLCTHQYNSIANPYDKKQKVFEAYAQNNTPSAYRVIWCYGPEKQQITILTIIPHP